MSDSSSSSTVKEKIKIFLQTNYPLVIALIIGILIGCYGMYQYKAAEIATYESQVKALQDELDIYKAQYQSAIESYEQAKVDLALSQLSEPEKIYIQGESSTEIVYVEKESEDDPDIAITQTPTTVKISYNDQVEELELETTESTTNNGGMVKITQESTLNLDITDIVNREIANTILQKDSEIYKQEQTINRLQRQKITSTAIGVLAGGLLYKAFD